MAFESRTWSATIYCDGDERCLKFIWANILKNKESIFTTSFPVEEDFDISIIVKEQYIRNIFKIFRKKIKKSKGSIGTIVISEHWNPWRLKIIEIINDLKKNNIHPNFHEIKTILEKEEEIPKMNEIIKFIGHNSTNLGFNENELLLELKDILIMELNLKTINIVVDKEYKTEPGSPLIFVSK